MSYSIKSVNMTRPCPICGKPDWCGFMPAEGFGEIVICQRAVSSDSVHGCDGRDYVCVGKSRSETYLFEEAEEAAQKKKGRNADRSFKENRIPVRYTVVDEVIPLSNDALDKVYRYFLNLLVLDEKHREWLRQEGWSDALMDKHLIKTMPIDDFKRYRRPRGSYYSQSPWRKSVCRQMAEKFGTLRGVPGFFRKTLPDGNTEWALSSRSGVIFPLYDIEGRIYSLRIRMDFEDAGRELRKDENGEFYFEQEGMKCYSCMKGVFHYENGKIFHKTGGKYRPFTSYYEDEEAYKEGLIVNKLKDGSQAFHSFGWYSQPDDSMYCCYITEGEKKGILGNHILKAPFISLPGVNSFSTLLKKQNGKRILDALLDRGIRCFIIAFDADKTLNEKVLVSEEKTIAMIKKVAEERGIQIQVGVANWDITLGKGIDDLLKGGHKPSFVLV
jgi:hypothetical protein